MNPEIYIVFFKGHPVGAVEKAEYMDMWSTKVLYHEEIDDYTFAKVVGLKHMTRKEIENVSTDK